MFLAHLQGAYLAYDVIARLAKNAAGHRRDVSGVIPDMVCPPGAPQSSSRKKASAFPAPAASVLDGDKGISLEGR